jgi:transcriptional regulator with GAF, ATPase, and Fis domain
MTRNIQLKKTGKEIGERIDFLREVTAALLDEVKALTPLKGIKLDTSIDLDEEVRKFEIYLIERALEKTGGSQAQAARLLKLKHTTLNAKIKRYEIGLKDLYNKSAFSGSE